MVAGLVAKTITPDGEIKPQSVACIGDSQLPVDYNTKNRQILIVPAAPKLVKQFSLRVVDLQLIFPKRAEIESKIRVNVAHNLTGRDAAECQIAARYLKIGTEALIFVFFY